MESLRYISRLRFSIQLLICEAAFLIGRPRREGFIWRLAAAAAGYFLLASGWYALLHSVPGDSPWVKMVFWAGLFVLTLGGMGLCFDLSPMELLFVGTGGYATEHIAFGVAKILQYATGWYPERIGTVADHLVFRFGIYVAVAAVVYLLLIRRNRDKESFRPGDGRIALLALIMLLAAIILSVFYGDETYVAQRTLVSEVIFPLYSMVSCVLVMLMEYYVLRENTLKRDQEMMEQLLQMANAQQKSSKETIDIINMKCHDLKHQVSALAAMRDDAARSEYVAEVKKVVSIYDATYHTGCEVLDYILREKTLLANQYHVTFSCMADGSAIRFLSSADLYALLGNALDNALERIAQEEQDQRIISLQIRRSGEMVLIHLENRCSRVPEFQDGLPLTDKADKNAHGFGVKSIRYLAEKYGGELYIRVQNGMFTLDILIPQPEPATP